MYFTNNAISKVNKYLHSEDIRKAKNEHIRNSGVLFGKIRSPFQLKEYYCKI